VGWLRGLNRKACAVGALCRYLVWTNDLSINFLATMKADLLQLIKYGPENYRPRWRNTYLIWGENTQKEVSSSTHITDIHRVRKAGNRILVYCATVQLCNCAAPA
jgi:hypothetical protein